MTGERPIGVAIVDDHPVVVEGVRAWLATEPRLTVLATGDDPDEVLRVAPDARKGLAVTLTIHPRRVPLFGRRPATTLGRAVQIASAPTTVVRDGVAHPRPMTRWTWYLHTAPLRLVSA